MVRVAHLRRASAEQVQPEAERIAAPAKVSFPPGTNSLKADHVLVAWKDSREARRAVVDALPLLAKAQTVSPQCGSGLATTARCVMAVINTFPRSGKRDVSVSILW